MINAEGCNEIGKYLYLLKKKFGLKKSKDTSQLYITDIFSN